MFSRFIIKKKWALYNRIVVQHSWSKVLPVILQPSRTQSFISFGFFTVWRWFCDEPTDTLADWRLRAAAVYRHQGAVSRAQTRSSNTESREMFAALFMPMLENIFFVLFHTSPVYVRPHVSTNQSWTCVICGLSAWDVKPSSCSSDKHLHAPTETINPWRCTHKARNLKTLKYSFSLFSSVDLWQRISTVGSLGLNKRKLQLS